MHLTFFFFNDTATTEIYTLSLHDALPISGSVAARWASWRRSPWSARAPSRWTRRTRRRSEEHTSELQSHLNLVCRLLLEKKKASAACCCRHSRGRASQLFAAAAETSPSTS